MRGYVHQVFLESLSNTFSEHSFYLTERIYHPNYPPEYFPSIPKNVQIAPEILDLKELDQYDMFIGIFGGSDMQKTEMWKIPTVWRTYVPISMNWKYLRGAPMVYNGNLTKDISVRSSKNQHVFNSNLDGPVAYDYRNPDVFKDWNGKIKEAIVVANLGRDPGLGKALYEKIKDQIPIRVIAQNIPYADLLQVYRDYRVYLELTSTARIISASITEAMTTGQPIVTNGVGEFKDLIFHGIDGYSTYIPNNDKEIIEYSKLLLENEDLAKDISIRARDKGKDLFSKARVRDAFEKAFYYALNGKWE